MELCSSGHDEICYDGGRCPFCSSIDEYERKVSHLEDDVSRLEYENRDLESQVSSLQSEVADLESQLDK
jgi:predicted RNase H-like nuclease (RuvC/YqgF family)